MIVGIFKRIIPDKVLRAISVTLIAGAGFLLIAFPLFVKLEIVTRESLYLNRKIKQETHRTVLPGETRKEVSKETEKDIVISSPTDSKKTGQILIEIVFADQKIYGRQTLQFVANKYDIPAEKLATDLNIPSDRVGEKLGRLRKQYAFTMNDVRKSILKNKE